jgi:polygalacturonase
MKKQLSILFLLLANFLFAHETQYNILNYGAVGDGKTINTGAIQKAIDECSSNGGGTVVIPAGEFVSGVFQLKSNITLFLNNGAILKASPNLEDYTLNGTRMGLIYTKDCDNVMIKGDGTIDLNGDKFNYMNKRKTFRPDECKKFTRQGMSYASDSTIVSDGPAEPHEKRPFQSIIFSNCKNVRISNIVIKNSSFWTVHLADCNGAIIDNVRILNDVLIANNDGIDCTCCSNVFISNCEIVGGDDAIVLDSYSVHFELPGFQNLKRPSENIAVSNCILMSRSSGIRIGGIDHNYMKNFSFNNIIIYNSNRGIGLFTGIEGGIENCTFSDITIETRLHSGDWWGKAEPIHISAYPTSASNNVGKIKNIRFRNIKAVGENGILLYGFEKGIISDITFDGLDLLIKNGPLQKTYGGNIDLRPVRDASMSLFKHDIPGIYMKNVENINFINSKIAFENNMEDFFTYGLWAEDFKDINITGLNATPPASTKDTLIFLENGRDFSLQNSFINAPQKSFMKKKNVNGKIVLNNNQFK